MTGLSERRVTFGMLIAIAVLAGAAIAYSNTHGGHTVLKRGHGVTPTRPGILSPGLLPVSVYTTLNVSSSAAVAACINTSTQCAAAFVQAVNADRQAHGSPPIALSWDMTNVHPGGCIGAKGHALHLASVGFSAVTAHDQFPADVCGSYSAAGENVGAYPGTKYAAMLGVLNLELGETWTPNCTFNHACNIRSPQFTLMSVGFARGADGNLIVVNTFKR